MHALELACVNHLSDEMVCVGLAAEQLGLKLGAVHATVRGEAENVRETSNLELIRRVVSSN